MQKTVIVGAVCFLIGAASGVLFSSKTTPQHADRNADIVSDEIVASETISDSLDLHQPAAIQDITDEISSTEQASDSGNIDDDINLLIQQNRELTESLDKLKASSTSTILKLRSRATKAEALLLENGIQHNPLTAEELKGFIPDEFIEFFENTPFMVNGIREFQQQEKDLGWAFSTEQQIKDYFMTHDEAAGVTLISVDCKTSICQMQGYETKPESLKKIMDDLRLEPWWQLSMSTGSSGYPSEKGKFFFKILSKII